MSRVTERGTRLLKWDLSRSKYCLLCNDCVESQQEIDFDECRGTTYKTVPYRDYKTFDIPLPFRTLMTTDYYVCSECMQKKGWLKMTRDEFQLQKKTGNR